MRKVIGSSPISSTKKKPHRSVWFFLFGGRYRNDSNPSKCNMPVACCGHQCKHWWHPYNLSPTGTNWQSSPISSLLHPFGWSSFFAVRWTRTHLNATVRWTVAEIRLDGFHTIHFRKAEMAIESYIVLIQPHSISCLNKFRPGCTKYPLFCQPPCNFRCCYSAYIAHSSNVMTI